MKQTLIVIALMSIAGTNGIEIPSLPTLPDIPSALIDNVPAAMAKPMQDAHALAQGLIGQINTKFQAVVPMLETAGTEGPKVIKGFINLVQVMATTDYSSIWAIPYMAKAAYPVADGLVKTMESAQPLVPGLAEVLTPFKLFKDALGVIRCPVAVYECVIGRK